MRPGTAPGLGGCLAPWVEGTHCACSSSGLSCVKVALRSDMYWSKMGEVRWVLDCGL
jgi:hypothetical protein